MRILTAEAMREVDRAAIEEIGIPSLVLMENAAIGVVEALCQAYGEAESAAVFCGPGNNGGDGLAVARHLAIRGFEVRIFLVTGGRPVIGDAACSSASAASRAAHPGDRQPRGLPSAREAAAECDLVVDALFGTGLDAAARGAVRRDECGSTSWGRRWWPSTCRAASPAASRGPSARIDGGPDGDLRGAQGGARLPAGRRLRGRDGGRPTSAFRRGWWRPEEEGGDLHLLMGEELAGLLPDARAGRHKGDYGHVLIVAGSPGKAGAAILAARAAVRSGAGLVTAAVPEPILQTVDLGSSNR